MTKDIKTLQAALHDYLAPHPQLGKDEDDRGCVPCFLIARQLEPVVVAARAEGGVDAMEIFARRAGHHFDRTLVDTPANEQHLTPKPLEEQVPGAWNFVEAPPYLRY